MPDNKQAYEFLAAKARELGWPRLWQTDLTERDRATLLATDAPQTFCWSVRESGTWLYTGRRGDLGHLLSWELHHMPGSRFFSYQGGTLTERSFHEAIVAVERLEATQNVGTVDARVDAAASLSMLLMEAATTPSAKHPS